MDSKYARINMIEFHSGEDLAEAQQRYAAVREANYPGLEFTVNVRTGPNSIMSLSIYGSEAAMEATAENHMKFMEASSDLVKDVFFYQGEVTALASELVTDGFVTFDEQG